MADAAAAGVWSRRARAGLSLASTAATFALQEWLHRSEVARLHGDEQRARGELARESGARLDVLLSKTHGQADDGELWGAPQGAAWLDVLLTSLWPDLLAGVVESIGPALADPVLNAYLNARDVVHIPEFITGRASCMRRGRGRGRKA